MAALFFANHSGRMPLRRPGAVDFLERGLAPAELRVGGAGLAAHLMFSPDLAGQLSIADAVTGAPIATNLASAIHDARGNTYRFPADFAPRDPLGYSTVVVRDPILGPSRRLTADFVSNDGQLSTTIEVTVSQTAPVLVYQLRAQASEHTPLRFSLLQEPSGALRMHGPATYLSLLSPGLVTRRLNGAAGVRLPLPPAAPVLIRSEADNQGVVLGTLDDVEAGSLITASFTGSGDLSIGITSGPMVDDALASPRIYLERTTHAEPPTAFAGFRAVMDVLAPQPPIPSTFRHQWDSWYVYYGEISDELIRRQIDTIARLYSDLGPWQVVIDAGWYRASADPDGEMGVVDRVKFPAGMRALVDYAHQHGIGVLLYASAPWIDSRPSEEDWWVVQQGFVRNHPEWLILVEEYEDGAVYVYDMQNAELRAYLDNVIRRYLVEFDADGILLDMVGIIGEVRGPLVGEAPNEMLRTARNLAQTMEVYRFFWESATRYKRSAWVEGAWAAPPLARRYAQTWRYGDEFPAFSHAYPLGGLLQHVTFGALQEEMLGRRTHLGFVYGGDGTWSIQQQWLAAAVALQRQVALSTDLAALPTDVAGMYREYLSALRPFSVEPTYGPGIPPEWFFTHVDGTTYLGLLNPSDQVRTVALSLEKIGFPATDRAIAFDPATRESLALGRGFSLTVPASTLRLVAIRAAPGVIWGDRTVTSAVHDDRLTIRVQPAPIGHGQLWVVPGRAGSLDVDGARMSAPPDARPLMLNLDGGPHEIRLRVPTR